MIGDPVSTRHCSVPVAASSAYSTPSMLPTYSVLPASTGRLCTGEPLSWRDHALDPSAVFSARIVPPAGTNRVDPPSTRSAVTAAGRVTCQEGVQSWGSAVNPAT